MHFPSHSLLTALPGALEDQSVFEYGAQVFGTARHTEVADALDVQGPAPLTITGTKQYDQHMQTPSLDAGEQTPIARLGEQ